MHNDVEKALLGALLIDPDKLPEVKLRPEDFEDRNNGRIFWAMLSVNGRGKSVDVLTVSDRLREAGYLDSIGGPAHLTELTNYVPTAAHASSYEKIIREKSEKRKLSGVIKEAGEIASDKNKTAQQVADEVKEKMHSAISQLTHSGSRFDISMMVEHTDEAKERYKQWGKLQGLSTGFFNIDHQTLGLVGGEMIIIAGKTSMGKTSLAMNIANNVAKAGHTVLFVTLEMTHAELTSRFMYLNGGETDDYYKVSAHIFYQKNDELNWKDIDGLIENAKQQIGAELVVIDHLHYFSREIEHVTQDIGRIAKEVKKNAIRHDVPIILISHVRKIERGKDATQEDLKDSAAIAQDADIVQMVGRLKDNGNMAVKIEKNRNRGKPTDRGERKMGDDYRDDPDVAELIFRSTKLSEPQETLPNNVFDN